MQVSIYYDKGGWSYLNARQNKRGYYFSVSPVRRENCFISYGAYTGARTCFMEVSRQTRKRYLDAKNMMDVLIGQYLVPFCQENGYELAPDYEEMERERNA